MSLFSNIYNGRSKYKGKECIDYITDAETRRKNYVECFYRQHPSLSRDCAMAYHCLLYNKDLTEEDRIIFNARLEEIRKKEDEKMKLLYAEFQGRIQLEDNQLDIIEREMDEMAYYTEEGKDMHEIPLVESGNYVSRTLPVTPGN